MVFSQWTNGIHYKSCESEIVAEEKTPNDKNLKPTIAEADYLEFLSIEQNSHRFSPRWKCQCRWNELVLNLRENGSAIQ